jgi:hypothetical protein
MSEVAMGTLYDLNKSAMRASKTLDIRETIKEKDRELFNFFATNKFAMLLCNEQKDYTVFAMISSHGREKQVATAKEELYTCLSNRGELLSFEKTEDGIAFEIWLRINEEIFVYYLFPYNEAVLVC